MAHTWLRFHLLATILCPAKNHFRHQRLTLTWSCRQLGHPLNGLTPFQPLSATDPCGIGVICRKLRMPVHTLWIQNCLPSRIFPAPLEHPSAAPLSTPVPLQA